MMFCYTSALRGTRKASPDTQRSTYLHTISNLASFSIEPTDNVLPVVPMFHASAWGYPFMAVTKGAKLTYPGPDMSPEGLVKLFIDEQVTFSAGVPTVWLGIQQYLAANPDADISSIRAFLCGGSAVPRAMIEWFWTERGIRVIQGWGMTETNPVASTAVLKPHMEYWSLSDQLDRQETAGIPIAGLQSRSLTKSGIRCRTTARLSGSFSFVVPGLLPSTTTTTALRSRSTTGGCELETCARSHPRGTSESPIERRM